MYACLLGTMTVLKKRFLSKCNIRLFVKFTQKNSKILEDFIYVPQIGKALSNEVMNSLVCTTK